MSVWDGEEDITVQQEPNVSTHQDPTSAYVRINASVREVSDMFNAIVRLTHYQLCIGHTSRPIPAKQV